MVQQNGLFKGLPEINGNTREVNKRLIDKAKKPNKSKRKTVRAGVSNKQTLAAKMQAVLSVVTKELKPDESLQLITTPKEFSAYIMECVKNGIVAVDVEASSLNTLTCELAGIGLYTPGQKAVYVPLAHKTTNEEYLNENLDKEVVEKGFKVLCVNRVKTVFHNAKYDIKVLNNQLLGYLLTPYWDTMLASNFLNENEIHKLKTLWDKYCNKTSEKSSSFDDLFDKIEFNYVPLDVAYLYAAKDPKITFELYEFQKRFLIGEQAEARGLYEAGQLLIKTEMPLVPVVSKMEITGIAIDKPYARELSERYTEKLTASEKVVLEYVNENFDFNTLEHSKTEKLSNPLNLNSPTQLAILFYDLMGLESPDRQKPRGTGEDIILHFSSKVKKHSSFFKDILEYRGLKKLLSTYIDKLPKRIEKLTGRLHGEFNQYGARTGRFSSSNPNLQNIPSKNKEIRRMFIASENYVLISADYSQQEPRVLAHLCHEQGDSAMLDAYKNGKDLYAWIASEVYRKPYVDCLAETSPEGKRRRDSMKNVLLGLMYGRGTSSVGEQLEVSYKEAEEIVEMLFSTFPKIQEVVKYYQSMAITQGYVQTVFGRKRRLPDISLPEYEITTKDGNAVSEEVERYYVNLMRSAYRKEKTKIKKEAFKAGIKIRDNGGKIAEAERQCLNSVIQGTSADITKRSMVLIGNSKELEELGYKMLLTVHDEVIGEAPKEQALKCAVIIKELMLQASQGIQVPMAVDAEITERWYGEDVTAKLN